MFQLARDISLEHDANAELEPGKVPHEVRRDMLDGAVVPPEAQSVIVNYGPRWGGTDRGFKIGFAADATPLWIKLVHEVEKYNLQHTGQSILEAYVDHVSGQQIQLKALVALAAEWVEGEVNTSVQEDGFAQLGWTRKNPAAHPFQILEDGAEYMVDPDTGNLANADGRLYAISLQGYAYDAMLFSSHMLAQSHPEQAARCAELATKIQQDTIKYNWLEDEQYFAAGWHHEVETGELQRIDMIALQASTLLATEIFRNLPDADKYIAGIWKKLYGPQLITLAGCRSKSVDYFDLLGFIDYHGPGSIWGISQAIAILGAINYGTPELGLHLGYSHLLYLEALGNWSEGLYVSRDGEIVLTYGGRDEVPQHRHIIANFQWQHEQMWTVALCLRLYLQHAEPQLANLAETEDPRPRELVDELSSGHNLRTRPASPEEVEQVRASARPWFIDTEAGHEAASLHGIGI